MQSTNLMRIVKFLKSPVLYILLIVCISLLILNVRYPKVGCDNYYFVPRLLDSYLYYLKNGIEIQWWTPTFGGGLPSYPNPQQIQFSIIQFFLFVMDPWLSINVTVVIFSIIGFYSVFSLLREELLFPQDYAILGATLFSVSGCFIEHLRTGHLSYVTLPLLPFIIVLLIRNRWPFPIAAIGLGLTFTYLVHSAAFYLGVVFLISIPMTLLLIYTLSNQIKPNFLRVSLIILIGGGIAILLSFSKFVAITSFMKYFPRHVSDSYEVSTFKALIGLAGQLFFTPIAMFAKRLYVGNILRHFTGARYGLWELDIGLSPVSLIIFFSAGIFHGKLQRRKPLRKQDIVFLLVIGLLAWIAIELSIAKGYIYTPLKRLVFMKSLRSNVRFASIFILPLTIVSMYSYSSLKNRFQCKFLKRINLTLLLSFIAIVLYTEYIQLPVYDSCHKFDITHSLDDWEKIRQFYEQYHIRYIAPISDARTFRMKASSINPYEPILDGEGFIKEGLVSNRDGKFFNMTNPASLVFPKENNLSLFERISVSDRNNFEKFITYHRPDWKLSKIQQIANYISLCTGVVILLISLFYFMKSFHKSVSGISS